jgi:tetratricopeptide (TPR) repeat protein
MRRRLVPLATLLVVVAVVAPPLRADLLHLDGGGVIDARRWWVEGDTLMYDSGAGTVGIPRGLVVRIEKAESKVGEPDEEPEKADSPPLMPRTTGGSPRIGEQKLRRSIEAFDAGKAALEARDFETAAARFLDALRDHPEFVAALVGHAVAEMAQGHDGLALGSVLEGLAIAPDHIQLQELLGDLRNREERVEDALIAWRKAFALSPNDRIREKIFKAERELDAGRYYAFSTTPHFNVRYDADVDNELASAVTDYLEEQFWTLSERFGHTPRQPITVLLYPTRQFRDVTQAADSVAGLFDGKIRVPLGGLQRINPSARAVLVHELTHAVVHSKTRGNCPRWLHEGLAQMSEGRELGPAELQAIRQRLEAHGAEDWENGEFSYPVALSLSLYLEQRGEFHGILDVLERLGEGRTIDDALQEVYGFDYAALCRRWAEDEFGDADR